MRIGNPIYIEYPGGGKSDYWRKVALWSGDVSQYSLLLIAEEGENYSLTIPVSMKLTIANDILRSNS